MTRGDGRVPPHDLEAEESLIGAMLLSRDAIVAASDVGVIAGDFYKPVHGHIFGAITSLAAAGEPADPVTVADELGREGISECSAADLMSLLTHTPASSSAGRYARIVSEAARRRSLIAAAGRLAEAGYDRGTDLVDVEKTLVDAMRSDAPNAGRRPFERCDLGQLMADGVPEPVRLVPWLYAECITTLQGEPEAGKSWIAAWLALQAMEAGWSVVYIDEEGGPAMAAERLLALGASPQLVSQQLWYYAFEQRRWDASDLAELDLVISAAHQVGRGLGLAVLDSLPDFLAAAGLSEDSAADVTTFVARVCGRFREAGVATLLLDHLTKPGGDTGGTKSRYARGSGAKLAKADATLMVETVDTFEVGKSGRLRIGKTKDRRGRIPLPRFGKGAMLHDVTVGEGSVRFSAAAVAGAEAWDGPTECMAAVLALFAELPDQELSQRNLFAAMKAGNHGFREGTIREAAERLVVDGALDVKVGSRNARLYRHRRETLDEAF